MSELHREATVSDTELPCDFVSRCLRGGAIAVGQPVVEDEYGFVYHLKCWHEQQSVKAERAFDQFAEDFYGGTSPVTMEEKWRAAQREKYGVNS